MQFAIEEQSFTDPETGVTYRFAVNRADSALVTLTSVYKDGHSRIRTFARNGTMKSEETFPAGVKPTIAIPTDNPSVPSHQQLADDINPEPNADGTPSETDEERRDRQAKLKADRQAAEKERADRVTADAKARAERDYGKGADPADAQPLLDEGGGGVVPAETDKPAGTQPSAVPMYPNLSNANPGVVNTSGNFGSGTPARNANGDVIQP